jgi:putative flippase GtrA
MVSGPGSPRRRLPLPAPVERLLALRFIKYGLVGVSNTVITYATYSLLVAIGVPYLIALLVGYVPGGVNSYLLNRHWTFEAGHLSHGHSGTRFAVVQSCAIAVNFGLLYLFVHDLHIGKYLSQAILTVPVVLITYFVNRAWTFDRREPLAGPSATR